MFDRAIPFGVQRVDRLHAQPVATLSVEEKQLRVQFAFFLRCRIGNDGQ
jgi:hypothetical protein